jgi:hypothetical protein
LITPDGVAIRNGLTDEEKIEDMTNSIVDEALADIVLVKK